MQSQSRSRSQSVRKESLQPQSSYIKMMQGKKEANLVEKNVQREGKKANHSKGKCKRLN